MWGDIGNNNKSEDLIVRVKQLFASKRQGP